MERVLVTIDEAAEALGVGRTTIYLLMKQQNLQQAKIGRRSLITAKSVRAYATKASGGDHDAEGAR